MSRIFISYRRKEGSKDAMALFERLARHFGADAVFMDVEGIALGVDFQEVLDRTLDTCSVMLLLMGPDWAEAKEESGERRLDDPNDFVRLEAATALGRKIPLIPVFLDGARMPKGNRLPEDLAALPRRQGMPLDHVNWRAQTAQLIQALERWLQPEAAGGPAVTQFKPGTVFRDSPDSPEMVVIPAGEFMMGSPSSEISRMEFEGPQHKVTIGRTFAVGKYPITFDEWDACVAAGGCKTKPEDVGWGRGRRPVINVSWQDAQAYVQWLSKKTGKNYRLLSEAEWEYAARAGTTTRYPWGDEPRTNRANFDGGRCETHPTPIDGACFGAETLDVTREFFPLGERPRFGDVLYVRSDAFATPGARIAVDIRLVNPAGVDKSPIPPVSRAGRPQLRWDLGTDRGWVAVDVSDGTRSLTQDGNLTISVPADANRVVVNGVEGGWLRARLVSGAYSTEVFGDYSADFQPAQPVPTMAPPAIASMTVMSSVDSGSQWGGKQTAPGGSFDPNKFGLHDMIGNVWEWVQDCRNDSYKGAPTDGSAWESGNCGQRVLRGGSWIDTPVSARVAYRDWDEPSNRSNNLGFRLARTL